MKTLKQENSLGSGVLSLVLSSPQTDAFEIGNGIIEGLLSEFVDDI